MNVKINNVFYKFVILSKQQVSDSLLIQKYKLRRENKYAKGQFLANIIIFRISFF